MNLLTAEKVKTPYSLETEIFNAVNKAETKNDIVYVKKAISRKGGGDETTEDIWKHWKKTLSILEEKKAKS